MLNSLQIFLKVVELGSFSKTASVLNMAPSSVARNIDSLEKELNVSLFNRNTRALRLTDKGALFLEGAAKLIRDAELLRGQLNNQETPAQGKLRISVFESFGRLHVCPIITEFLQRYPRVELEIEFENRLIDLVNENIDVAIRIGEQQDSQLKARILLSNHTLVCASPEYLARHGTPEQPAELQQHNCLILNQGRQRSYWHFKKGRQHKKILVNGNLKSKGGTPLLSACLDGLGIVQLSNWMLSDFVKNGQLVVLLEDWESSLSENSSGDIYVLYKASAYPNPLIRLFIDYLLEKTQNKALQRLVSD